MSIRLPEIQSLPEMALESLVKEIRAFQARIPEDTDLGIVANGGPLVIHVERVHLSGQMIVFEGVDDAERQARLIQHYSQVAVQLVAVPKLQDEPRRIGFHSPKP